MPFTQEQLDAGSKAAIDNYLRNNPIDQVNIAHPLYTSVVSTKKDWGGGLENVVEQLRFSNDSNFQSYFGDQQVSYNRKRTLQQAKYSWGAFHDGFGLNEDELAQNGIIITDDRSASPSRAEMVQLTNLLQENLDTLRLGFQENMDLMLHRDGSQSTTDIAGLDALVSLDPGNGIVGGLDPSSFAWWQNYAKTGIKPADLIAEMEIAWRECIRYGGSPPDKILVGSEFVDTYRAQSSDAVARTVFLGDRSGNRRGAMLDASVGEGINTGLYFKGVELIWDPVFDLLDSLDSPTIPWTSRCYFLNMKHLKLRPIRGHWLVNRKPPRVYDRYVHYWATTAKAAMTTNKRRAHAAISLY